jgi:hypothetical protein
MVYRPKVVQKATKKNAVNKSLIQSCQELQGSNDALRGKLQELKEEASLSGPNNRKEIGTGDSSVGHDSAEENNCDLQIGLRVLRYSKTRELNPYYTAIAGAVGGLCTGRGSFNKGTLACAGLGTLVGAAAAWVWNNWVARPMNPTLGTSVPKCTAAELVAFRNRMIKPNIASIAFPCATLVGELRQMSNEDVRSVRHGGARRTKGVRIQSWNICSMGKSKPLLVNGDLLYECMSDVHSKDKSAARALICHRTTNVAHFNAIPEYQSVMNSDTRELLLFLIEDFH